jgi:hypothetical protein
MKTVTLDPVAFLRAGGVLSMAEWIQMDGDEQEAFEAAGDALRGALAERIADEVVGALAAIGEHEQLTEMVDRALKENG